MIEFRASTLKRQGNQIDIVECTEIHYKPAIIFTRIIYITICRRTLPYRAHIAIYSIECIGSFRSIIRLSNDLVICHNISAQCQVCTGNAQYLNRSRTDCAIECHNTCHTCLIRNKGIAIHMTSSSRSDFIRNGFFHCLTFLVFRSCCQYHACTTDKRLRVSSSKRNGCQNRHS